MGNKMSGETDDVDDQNENVFIDFTPVCRYGLACYRKNPEHFKKFRHPHLPRDSENETGKEVVHMKIEIGHDATLKTTKSPQGHTHDWTAFVRSTNQSATGIFLEKVEFSYPQSLARSPLIANQPPFCVSDSGSRSFVMNVDIYFKSFPDPRKIRIDYDLYLKDNASFSNVRQVKLTIQNPSPTFRQRLLLAGGVIVQVPDSSTWDNVRQSLPSTSLTNKRKVGDQAVSNDECDAFGQLCTTKLRKLEALSPPQKTLAEKLISEVLFHAEQKSLTNESCVHLTSSPPMSPTVNDHSSPLRTVKMEPSEGASSGDSITSPDYRLLQTIKPELDSTSSSEDNRLHQDIKPELNSISSSEVLLQAVKTEVDTPSSSADIEECVILRTIKSEKPEPLVVEINEETTGN